MGLIYLLHFERSYHHARHYLGYTDDLDGAAWPRTAPGAAARWWRPRSATGSSSASPRHGRGTATEERRLHRYRNSPRRLCPICRAEPRPGRRQRRRTAGAASWAGDERLVAALARAWASR